MDDINFIEQYYHKFIKNPSKWLPEGLIDINIELLNKYDLLEFRFKSPCHLEDRFQKIERKDKTILINDQFIVWLVPNKSHLPFATYILIALNKKDEIKLEAGFKAKGLYNDPEIVLRLVEKVLAEIEETEDWIRKLES